jgi:hypothetical protein
MGELNWRLRRPTLWGSFAVASVWLACQGWVAEAAPYGDVSFVYQYWAAMVASGGPVVGVTTPWVYPIAALAPIMLATTLGLANYALAWIAMVTLVNAAAFGLLLGRSRTSPARRLAAWWWIAFLLALGPVSVARLDSLVTPLAIAGLLLALSRPAIAAFLLSLGTWIKIWPVALLATLVIAARQRWRIALTAGATSVAIILIATLCGAGLNIVSFLGQQSSRGLQIESPWATPFLWLASAQVPDYSVSYNRDILTFEVSGAGAEIMGVISSNLLAVAVAAILVIGFFRMRNGANPLQLIPALTLALTISLIVFNKVGSPQYIGWLAAPVIAGIVFDRRKFVVPAVVVLLTALSTQLFYPYAYQTVLTLQPAALAALTLRNVLEIVIFVVALRLVFASKVK